MKKNIWVILMSLCLVCVTLSGCKKNVGTPEDNAIVEDDGEETVERENYLFGYSCTNLEDPYFQAIKKSLEVAVQKEDAGLLVKDAQSDAEQQNQQIQEMIDAKVDAVFLTPVDSDKITEGLQLLEEANIPVINIDIRVKETDLVDAYVGSDNRNAGYVCGEDLLAQCPEGGKILIMENSSVSSMNERITGFERAIANEGFSVLSRAQMQGDREHAKEKMKEFLAAYSQIDAVMCANDQIALGVLDAAQEAGRTDMLVYSVDGSPQIKTEIAKEDSLMRGTGAQSPIKVGQSAAEVCLAVLEGEEYKSEIQIETVFIYKENVELYGTNGWQ